MFSELLKLLVIHMATVIFLLKKYMFMVRYMIIYKGEIILLFFNNHQ